MCKFFVPFIRTLFAVILVWFVCIGHLKPLNKAFTTVVPACTLASVQSSPCRRRQRRRNTSSFCGLSICGVWRGTGLSPILHCVVSCVRALDLVAPTSVTKVCIKVELSLLTTSSRSHSLS
ncbi:hypothetical protein M758_2G062700 [Ceratodon purpureus]|nr:hypothetical protein M758_2G062700 [Ceratodon purpureus]